MTLERVAHGGFPEKPLDVHGPRTEDAPMLEADPRKPAGTRSGQGLPSRSARALERFLSATMRNHLAVPGRTKRTAARLALVAAIRQGHLQPGALLPPEKALTAILGVSLGTVQAALRQLQQTGTIVRRRGDGTRVASAEPLSQSVWHFRFLDRTTLLPVRFTGQEIAISRTTATGPWSAFLENAEAFIRIQRLMAMSDGARVFAEMYLDEARTPGLLSTPVQELDMVNIRPYLEETFGLRTARAGHIVQVATPSPAETRAFGLEARQSYFEIHARAFTGDGAPVYFQRIFAKASRYALDF